MVQSLLIAFGVPIVFLFSAAMGRKLVRGTPWEREDFYFGVQLTLATLSSDMLFILELLRAPGGANFQYRAITATLFLMLVVGIYVWLLTLHQDWQKGQGQQDRKGELLRLMVISNLAGILLFAAFVFQIKGIR